MPSLSIVLSLALLLSLCGLAWMGVQLRSANRSRKRLLKISDNLEADLADRRVIERELAHMASFADMSPHPIVEIHKDQSLGYINPTAEQMFPTLAQEGLRHPLLQGVVNIVQTLIRDQKSLFIRPVKIGERVYDQQISVLDGGPRVRLYMSDITELKRMDQLKSDFVNMVSHELRSPLTSIAASIKMISSGMLGPLSKDMNDLLKLSDGNIDRLARMINDLLDVSKIEAGKLELRRAQADLSQMVKEVSSSFEPLARERGLDVRIQLSKEPIQVMIDRDKIQQVFTNLISNALKFTQTGYIEISAEQQDNEVRCRVSDTGPGIDPADLPKIFGKFQQLGHAPKGRESGTGLGLSLCKGLVELHGGRIWVESELAKGTHFLFVLPSVSSEEITKNRIQELFRRVGVSGKPLSLVRLMVRDWDLFTKTLKGDQIEAFSRKIREFVQLYVRNECDFSLDIGGDTILALPEVAREDAMRIAQRIQAAWPTSVLVKQKGLPAILDVRIVNYPEDATLPEELFTLLTALKN